MKLKDLTDQQKIKWFDKFFEDEDNYKVIDEAPCLFHESWVCGSRFSCIRTGECPVG